MRIPRQYRKKTFYIRKKLESESAKESESVLLRIRRICNALESAKVSGIRIRRFFWRIAIPDYNVPKFIKEDVSNIIIELLHLIKSITPAA